MSWFLKANPCVGAELPYVDDDRSLRQQMFTECCGMCMFMETGNSSEGRSEMREQGDGAMGRKGKGEG
jgi:hypothetical protein